MFSARPVSGFEHPLVSWSRPAICSARFSGCRISVLARGVCLRVLGYFTVASLTIAGMRDLSFGSTHCQIVAVAGCRSDQSGIMYCSMR